MTNYVFTSPFEYNLQGWECPPDFSYSWNAEECTEYETHCLLMHAPGRCDVVLVVKRLKLTKGWAIVHDPFDVAGLRWKPKSVFEGVWFPPANKFGRKHMANFARKAISAYLQDRGGLVLRYTAKNWRG